MQLWLTLICPPTNHLANGGCQSSTCRQGRDQSTAWAISPQKADGSSLARFQSVSDSVRLETCAWPANSGGGGKTRVSLRMLWIASPPGWDVMVRGLHGRRPIARASPGGGGPPRPSSSRVWWEG